jgi:hypothetical protein
MSLFWPPSPRTFGGSYRWLRDRHPLRLCVLRSVRVAQRRQGRQIKAGRPQGTSLNDNHPLPPTFATKSALFGHAAISKSSQLSGIKRKLDLDPARAATGAKRPVKRKQPRN